MRPRSATSIRPMADAMTTAASAAYGQVLQQIGRQQRAAAAIASAPTTPVSCVFAPGGFRHRRARRAAADREALEEAWRPDWRRPDRPSPGCGSTRCRSARGVGAATARWCRRSDTSGHAAEPPIKHRAQTSSRPIKGNGEASAVPAADGRGPATPARADEIERARRPRCATDGRDQDARYALDAR